MNNDASQQISPSEGFPLAADEFSRLHALKELQILDTPPEETFDSAVRLAASACDTPIAMISLVDRFRQWPKARIGFDVRETPRQEAFCSHAILGRDLFEVTNARTDARFASYPLVTGESAIGFYAGMPLVTSSGLAMGTLCVMDHVPRQLDERQRATLHDLAVMVMSMLENRKTMEESRQLGLILNGAFDEILVVHPRSQRIQYANANALSRLGYRLDELQQVTLAHLGSGYPMDRIMALGGSAAANDSTPLRFEAAHTRKNGSTYQVEVRATVSNSEASPQIILLANDISTRKLGETILRRQATTDGVTGLMNRRSFESRLRFSMQRVRHDGGSLALLMIELGRLTEIRHSYGQQVADMVLADFADRLSKCAAANDLVAHLGGDEFIILIESRSETCDAATLAAGIGRNLERCFTWEQSSMSLTATIGVVYFTGADEDAASFLARADAAVNIAFLEDSHLHFMPAMHAPIPAAAMLAPAPGRALSFGR